MVAPTFEAAGTADATAGDPRTPGIPTGVVDGSMVLGIMSIISNLNPGAGSGFNLKYDSEAMGATANPNVLVQWKVATGSEGPGDYAWPVGSALAQGTAQAFRVENEQDDADPFHTDADAIRTAATSTFGTVSITGVPAGSTLVWVGAPAGDRTTSGPAGYERQTAAASQTLHVFTLEDYAGGDPSVSGVVYIGGNTSNTAVLFALLPSTDAPHEGSATGTYQFDGSATGTTTRSGTAVGTHQWDGSATGSGGKSGSATGTHQWDGSATGIADYFGSADGSHVWNGTAESTGGVTEYVEDWTDLADVNATGVEVLGNRLYSSGGTGTRGYVKAFEFPPTGLWRAQQVIHNVDAGLQNPTIKLGFSCADPETGIVNNDPDALGIEMSAATRARSTFKGSNLSGVTILNEEIVGVGPTTDDDLLFTIDATETSYSFALKARNSTRAMIAFRILRSDLAAEGKQPTKLYAFFTDARVTGGSSLSPFIYQTGSLAPTATTTVAGQQIEGRAQRIIVTSPEDASPFVWWCATPADMNANSGIIAHIPQSLTGEGHDAWTDVRMEDVTRAIQEAGFIWMSSTDTVDRFGNPVEITNYTGEKEFLESIVGTGRDLFTLGTSMGTIAAISMVARGDFDARAAQTIGFAGSFRWIWDEVPEKRPEIIDAFDVAADGSDLEAKTAGYDPLLSFTTDPDFAGRGFRFNTGTTDAITPTALSDDMSAIVLANGATEGVVNEYPGGHLDIDQYQGDDLVAFYLRNASVPEGSATGTHEWDGSASGTTERSGTAIGSHQWDGSATGQADREGSATGSHQWDGSATGTRTPEGSATGTHQWDGSATGRIEREGSATGTHEWNGTATGEFTASGSATGSHVWDGVASGFHTSEGSATGSHVWDGEAVGTNGETNFAVGSHVWNGSADGIGAYFGSATGSHVWDGSATGTTERSGSATGEHQWDGSADGTATHSGSATGTHQWDGTATGGAANTGSATGTYQFDGTASGEFTPAGSASGTYQFDGTATGSKPSKGLAAGTFIFAGNATGTMDPSGSATGSHVWDGTATGVSEGKFGSATGTHVWNGSAAGTNSPPTPVTHPVLTIRTNPARTTIRENPAQMVIT